MHSLQVQQVQVKNILNKTKIAQSDFTANPYVGCSHNCLYCYASYMQHFNPHTANWGQYVDIKHWPSFTPKQQQLYAGKKVCIGTVTDPYQPIEAQALRTRALLEQLLELNCRIMIITKSDLIMRDFELLQRFPQVEIAWSICTLDERFRYDIEQPTIPIAQRFAAMQFFHNQGFKTLCFIAPIFPVFTDVFGIINYARDKCSEVLMDPLNLRCQNRQLIFNYIRQVFPQFAPLYHQIYELNDQSYWYQLSEQVEYFAASQGYPLNGQAPTTIPTNMPSNIPSNTFLSGPNLICTFGKFKHLEHFRKTPEEEAAAKARDRALLKQAQAAKAARDSTSKRCPAQENQGGYQSSLFDLDQES